MTINARKPSHSKPGNPSKLNRPDAPGKPMKSFTPGDLLGVRAGILRYLPAALAATGPVLAIVLVAALEPAMGPRTAAAAPVPTVVTPPAPIQAVASAPQLAAEHYATKLRARPAAASPFYEAEHEARAKPAPTQTADNRAARQHTQAELKLTAIVSGRENIAVINGKLRRVGEDASQGWIVESIDPSAGVITLRHPQDGVRQVALNPTTPTSR